MDTVPATQTNFYQNSPGESPSKWRDLIAELAPDASSFRLEYARGNRGAFMASGDPIDILVKDVDGTAIIEVTHEDIAGDHNSDSLADEIYMLAWLHWKKEQQRTPQLKLLRSSLVAIGKKNDVLAEETIRLTPKTGATPQSINDLYVSDQELDDTSGGGRMGSRDQFNLRRHNQFLVGTVEGLLRSQIEIAQSTTHAHVAAKEMLEAAGAQVMERIQHQQRELEADREERISDARTERIMGLAEIALMGWMAKQGMPMPGQPSPSPHDGTSTPGAVTVETRAQTLAREILELMDDDKWTLVKSVDMEVAEDLRSALEQHTEGADDLEAALSAVLPRTLPHAPKFAPMLPQEVVARVLELNGLLSR